MTLTAGTDKAGYALQILDVTGGGSSQVATGSQLALSVSTTVQKLGTDTSAYQASQYDSVLLSTFTSSPFTVQWQSLDLILTSNTPTSTFVGNSFSFQGGNQAPTRRYLMPSSPSQSH